MEKVIYWLIILIFSVGSVLLSYLGYPILGLILVSPLALKIEF